MKKYVLKKDLPTFKAGETFYLSGRGHLVQEMNGVVAYMNPTLEKFNILDGDWFEELPEEYERWRAEDEQEYFYIDGEGFVRCAGECFFSSDDRRFALGNYFKTAEEAGKARDWLIAFTILRDDTKGFKPNWKDETEDEYFVAYNHRIEELWIGHDFRHQKNLIYFKSEEDARASIEAHEKEWLTYFGIEGKVEE